MKSPFPGLDPYLEAFWSNVHTSMMTYIRDQLQGCLPEGLWTRVEESVTIDDPDEGTSRTVRPDVHVTDEQPWAPVWNQEVGGLAVAEPLVIVDEPLKQRHIEIVDTRTGGSLVTAIEVLSPANKTGILNRQQYISKRRAFTSAGVNLVEIDLIRAGSYIVSAPEEKVPGDDYLISVHRVTIPWPEWEVYPVSLRKPVPAFRIPLRRGDEDVALDLQAVLDQCYENGGYHLGIDYTQEPTPQVSQADVQWMDELLRENKLRV